MAYKYRLRPGSYCIAVLLSIMAVLFLLCAFWMGLVAAWPEPQYALEHAEVHFERFIQDYDRHYADESEKQARFLIFKDNFERAIRMNEKSTSAIFGITKFMDLTLEEFRNLYTGFKKSDREGGCKYIPEADINYGDAPESFDWRDQNVVSPVKNQLHCGSCYSFSSTGNIESQFAIKHKKQILLSEQQILDCDSSNHGCAGGFMTNAFRYLINAGGLEGEVDYTYHGVENKCSFDASKVRVKLADCHAYNLTSQEKVKQLLYHTGPISIAIRGDGVQGYHWGIISDHDCFVGDVSHAVLLVGYGTSAKGVPYWIIKNSWGSYWGENGYFRIYRGEGADSCGMMNESMSSAVIE